MQSIAIKDANILIDCAEIELLDAVFQLPLVFKTTDFIWQEILVANQQDYIQPYIRAERLKVTSFTADEVLAISQLQYESTGISIEDSSALYLARKDSAILLTGDGKLRRVAQQTGIQVHGIIWLLDEVLRYALIDTASACKKIKLLKSKNPRLPAHALQERIRQWCGE